jgi:hypothetical protein
MLRAVQRHLLDTFSIAEGYFLVNKTDILFLTKFQTNGGNNNNNNNNNKFGTLREEWKRLYLSQV